MLWQDVTQYKPGEKGVVEPRSWLIESGTARVWLSKEHKPNAGLWVIKAPHIRNGDALPLGLAADATADEAKTRALKKAGEAARELADKIAELEAA